MLVSYDKVSHLPLHEELHLQCAVFNLVGWWSLSPVGALLGQSPDPHFKFLAVEKRTTISYDVGLYASLPQQVFNLTSGTINIAPTETIQLKMTRAEGGDISNQADGAMLGLSLTIEIYHHILFNPVQGTWNGDQGWGIINLLGWKLHTANAALHVEAGDWPHHMILAYTRKLLISGIVQTWTFISSQWPSG